MVREVPDPPYQSMLVGGLTTDDAVRATASMDGALLLRLADDSRDYASSARRGGGQRRPCPAFELFRTAFASQRRG